MAHHPAADHEDDDDEHDIHLPPPSFAPLILSVGVTVVCFGLLWSALLIAVGGAVFLAGLALWLVEDARGFAEAPDTGGHH